MRLLLHSLLLSALSASAAAIPTESDRLPVINRESGFYLPTHLDATGSISRDSLVLPIGPIRILDTLTFLSDSFKIVTDTRFLDSLMVRKPELWSNKALLILIDTLKHTNRRKSIPLYGTPQRLASYRFLMFRIIQELIQNAECLVFDMTTQRFIGSLVKRTWGIACGELCGWGGMVYTYGERNVLITKDYEE